MEAITAPPEMAQLPLASVWKDTTALGGTHLHDLPHRQEVNSNNNIKTHCFIAMVPTLKHLGRECDIETVCYWLSSPLTSFQIMFSKLTNAVFLVSAASRTRWTVSFWPLLPAGFRLSFAVSTWNLLQPLQISLPGPSHSALTHTSLAEISHRFLTYFSHPSLAFQ